MLNQHLPYSNCFPSLERRTSSWYSTSHVLMALLLDEPVIAISFHHKCALLRTEMESSDDSCHDINQMDAGRLIERFQELEKSAERLKPLIRQKVEESRKAFDEQYNLIIKML